MGVPVSKLKLTNDGMTLTVKKKKNSTEFHNPAVVLIKSTSNDNGEHLPDDAAVDSNVLCTDEKQCPENNDAHLNQLKFIDESSETSYEKDEVENDNDSGNASISSDTSHHEDSSNECESNSNCSPSDGLDDRVQLRKQWTTLSLQSHFRLSTTNTLMKRYSTQNLISQFEHCNINKLISKLNTGDLIEIRCLCNCVGSNQLRASINHRQRFRRTLQRQSFHQIPTHATSNSKRHSSLCLKNVWRRSCISGSISDFDTISSNECAHKATLMPTSLPISSDQCSDQFHYVYVEKVGCTGGSLPDRNLLNDVWCFHVKPYQRVELLDDDRNLGIIKYETLDSVVKQFLVEMEERHLHCGRGSKQPKLSVFYQIRNQDKLSQSILKQTLNAIPEPSKIIAILTEVQDSYVRYNKSTLNSEHYATLWKYGIGWSTWANGRNDILYTLRKFVQSFSQLTPNNKITLQSGECMQDHTNLIVQCFGLHGSKLEHSIEQWIQSQVVIAKSHQVPQLFSEKNQFQEPEETGVREEHNTEEFFEKSINSVLLDRALQSQLVSQIHQLSLND